MYVVLQSYLIIVNNNRKRLFNNRGFIFNQFLPIVDNRIQV